MLSLVPGRLARTSGLLHDDDRTTQPSGHPGAGQEFSLAFRRLMIAECLGERGGERSRRPSKVKDLLAVLVIKETFHQSPSMRESDTRKQGNMATQSRRYIEAIKHSSSGSPAGLNMTVWPEKQRLTKEIKQERSLPSRLGRFPAGT